MVYGQTTVTGIRYYAQDDFGNVQGQFSDSGAVTETVAYGDWGLPTISGGITNRLTWKGLSYDPDVGLTYMRARWYDPNIGRFVSEDPAGLQGGINPYVFANNDPINGADPSGMDPDDPYSLDGVSITAESGYDWPFSFETLLEELGGGGSGSCCSNGNDVGRSGVNGGRGKSAATPHKPTTCTAARQAAAQLARSFENASKSTGWIAFGAGVTTAVSGAGEGITFGADTPVTITFGSITGFFATASTITGGAGAVLNSFASGNMTALQNFGWGQVANLTAKAAASRIPTVEPWSDTIGDLAERASDLTHRAQEVCR